MWGAYVKYEMWSGTTITSHRELHCIHDLRFHIDLALVLARIRLSGVNQPESPGVAAWRMLKSESRIWAEEWIRHSKHMQVFAPHPGNLKSENIIKIVDNMYYIKILRLKHTNCLRLIFWRFHVTYVITSAIKEKYNISKTISNLTLKFCNNVCWKVAFNQL